jgi:Fe-S-cluster containining protein
VLRWHREGRNDILSHLVDDHLELEVDGWFHPATRERLEICPFLEQHTDGATSCAIQHTKPLACSHYRPGRCAGLKPEPGKRPRKPRATQPGA